MRPEAVVQRCSVSKVFLTLFRIGLFKAAYGWGRQKGFPSVKAVTHILELWNLAQLHLTQRRLTKYVNHVIHPLSSADISIFSPEISKLRYIKIYRYKFSILMMSTKTAILGLFKIKVFWKKNYDVITYVFDVINKILSRVSNYIVDVVMRPIFGNSCISMREVITIWILYKFDQKKTHFLRGGLGSHSTI